MGVEERHPPVGGVVRRHLEGDDLELSQTRRHAENFPPMCWLVDVSLRWLRVRHPSRVPAHDVEAGPGRHPGLGVPLDLCGPGVHHGGGEDGEDGGGGVQHPGLHDGLVLLHPHRQGDVVVLGPAAQGMQEEHGL